jgi:hypothetical protein
MDPPGVDVAQRPHPRLSRSSGKKRHADDRSHVVLVEGGGRMAPRAGATKADRDSRLLAWLAVGFGELLGGLAVALGMLLVPALFPAIATDVSIACAIGVAVLAVIAAAATVWFLRSA